MFDCDEIDYRMLNCNDNIFEIFKCFLRDNKFSDMSDILVMRLDTYAFIQPFVTEYARLHLESRFINELLYIINKETMFDMSDRFMTKDQLIKLLKNHYNKLLYCWYNKNKSFYIIHLNQIKHSNLDIIISKAIRSELYY